MSLAKGLWGFVDGTGQLLKDATATQQTVQEKGVDGPRHKSEKMLRK
jgi:hypothetical protein